MSPKMANETIFRKLIELPQKWGSFFASLTIIAYRDIIEKWIHLRNPHKMVG